jgi:hypothetical protein
VTAFPTAIPNICCHCGKSGGVFERATYEGAPHGGVPVHRDCLSAFFDSITIYEPFSAEAIALRRGEAPALVFPTEVLP